jgi:tRNA pseudouridine38-40 synthase
MDTDAVLRGINALLPIEIRVLSVEEVSAEFHARLSARSKDLRISHLAAAIVSRSMRGYVYAFRYRLRNKRWIKEHSIFAVPTTSLRLRRLLRKLRIVHESYLKLRGSDQAQLGYFRIRGNGFLSTNGPHHRRDLAGGRPAAYGPHQLPEVFAARDRRMAGPRYRHTDYTWLMSNTKF